MRTFFLLKDIAYLKAGTEVTEYQPNHVDCSKLVPQPRVYHGSDEKYNIMALNAEFVENCPEWFKEIKVEDAIKFTCQNCRTVVTENMDDFLARKAVPLCYKCRDTWMEKNEVIGLLRDVFSVFGGWDAVIKKNEFIKWTQENKTRILKITQDNDLIKLLIDIHKSNHYSEDDMIDFALDAWGYLHVNDDYVDRTISIRKAFEEWKQKKK